MTLTDTHTHLYYPDFKIDVDKMMRQAMQRGITRFFLPNVDSESIPLMYDVHQKYPNTTFMMMGLHPCSVKENVEEELAICLKELNSLSFVGIGEIGIDLYWDKTFLKQQQDAFATQINWAIDRDLPFVIHSRNAFEETFEVLDSVRQSKNNIKYRGIFHCFSGTIKHAERAIEMGLHLGVGGVVTFKNSGLDKIVEAIDLKHIVLETDAPYLAPNPFRGKVNMPEYLYYIAEHVAMLKQMHIKQVAEITTENSMIIFGK